MRRVLFVTPWFGVFAGGAERAVRDLARELHRRWVEVEVWTTCSASPYESWVEDRLPAGSDRVEGIPVRRFPLDKDRLDRYERAVQRHEAEGCVSEEEARDFFSCGIGSEELVAQLGELPEDLPVVACPYFQSLVYRSIVARPGGVYLMPAFHDEPQFHWTPVRELVGSARGLLFLSEEEKSLAVRHYGTLRGRALVESPVVGLGLDADAALGDLEADALHCRRLGLPDDFVLTLGRKERGKGVAQLVDWYREYGRIRERTRRETPPLALAGGGDASLVPDEPLFRDLGYVSEWEKLALLRRARATVQLSRNESFPYAVLESLASATPVIVSAECAVTAGHCQRSGGGWPVDGKLEFFGALDALADPDLRERVGAAGRRYVERRFDWEPVLDRLARTLWPT